MRIGLKKFFIDVDNFLHHEGKWTQNASARDKECRAVDHGHKAAVCWCLSAVIAKLLDRTEYGTLDLGPFNDFVQERGYYNIRDFNDFSTFEQMKKGLKDFIATLN
jgi:hypothetical protein